MPKSPRILAVGRPGTGKTGALAALVNAGFRLGIADFEGNLNPLVRYIKPELLNSVNVVTLRDKIGISDTQLVNSVGQPMAFRNSWKLVDGFKGVTLGGEEADWGPVKDWDPRTVFVIDGLTQMGDAAFRRTRALNSRTLNNTRIQDWGVVQQELAAYFYTLESTVSCPVYVISHLKMIGPKLLDAEKVAASEEVVAEVNARIVDVVPTRLYPTAPGQNLAQTIAGQFDTCIYFDTKEVSGGKTVLVIRTAPTPAVDVKVAVPGIPAELPVATGLLTLMNGLTGRND